MISVAIEPKTKADQEKLAHGLQRLAEEDPTFRVTHRRGDRPDADLRHGRAAPRDHRRPPAARVQGRRERRPAAGRLPRDDPASRPRRSQGKFVRQTGGRGQYGHVVINLEPHAPGEGFEFVNKIKGGTIPTEYIPPVEQGIEEALEPGVQAGYPMVDVRVELIDGSYHEVDSSEMAFKIAGSMAFKEALQARQADAARADHGGRGRHARGVPRRRDRRPQPPPRPGRGPGAARQRASRSRPTCRCREMFGYATDLRSMTAGPRDLHDAVRPLRGGSQSIASEIVDSQGS